MKKTVSVIIAAAVISTSLLSTPLFIGSYTAEMAYAQETNGDNSTAVVESDREENTIAETSVADTTSDTDEQTEVLTANETEDELPGVAEREELGTTNQTVGEQRLPQLATNRLQVNGTNHQAFCPLLNATALEEAFNTFAARNPGEQSREDHICCNANDCWDADPEPAWGVCVNAIKYRCVEDPETQTSYCEPVGQPSGN
jgi:hypothetical protein